MATTTPPLSLGEILDRTVQLYRRNFALLVGVALLPAALDVLITGAAGIYMSAQFPNFQTPGATPNFQAVLGILAVFAAFLLLGVPLLLGVFAMAFSALNFTATQRNRGEAVTIRSAYAYAFRFFWRHVGIFFLQMLMAAFVPGSVFVGILFIGGMLVGLLAATGAGKVITVLFGFLIFLMVIALAVVSVWIWLRFCLAYPVSFAEGKKAWDSLKRSAQLSKGSRGRIFVMYILVAILAVIAMYALVLPIDLLLKFTVFKAMPALTLMTQPPVALQVVNLCISLIQRALVMPIYSIALLLFYNDQRTRQEGYDIELLMAQAGWSELPAPAAPAPSTTHSPEPHIPEPAPAPDSAPDSAPAPPSFTPDPIAEPQEPTPPHEAHDHNAPEAHGA